MTRTITRTFGDRLFALGYLLSVTAFLFKNDLFPENRHHGHWFWTAVAGGVFSLTGLLLKWPSRRKQATTLTQP